MVTSVILALLGVTEAGGQARPESDEVASPGLWPRRRQVTTAQQVVRQYETQLDGIEYLSLLANATNGAPIPRWRSTLRLGWTRGSWGATLGQSYASGYVEPMQFGDRRLREVVAASTWDVQARYAGLPGWHLAAGIRNLFDEAPPFSLTSSFQFGFNLQVASHVLSARGLPVWVAPAVHNELRLER